MTSYHRREITHRLERALKQLPVVVISGLRQAGKSTMLQKEARIASKGEYRTLDDFALLAAARANPDAFLSNAWIVDEVQRCPELLISVKRSVDSNRKNGEFILSGSANLALLENVTETLAGRAAYFCLEPMTRREIRRETERPPRLLDLVQNGKLPAKSGFEPVRDAEIQLGGLPPVCLNPKQDSYEWWRGYVQTYVERDVRQISQIGDSVGFQLFVQLTALRTAQIHSISNIARDAKITHATASRYAHLLDLTFLTRKLPPYLNNKSARLVKSPKIYITDSGLAAHLAGAPGADGALGSQLRGQLFETYLLQNLSAILAAHEPRANIYYWGIQGRNEVDFIIEMGSKVIAIEAKASESWNTDDLRGLRAFVNSTPNCTAAVLAYNGSQTVQLDERLWAIPASALLA